MESVTNANFGPLIAYLVPGATVLVGFSQFSPVLRSWFGASPADAPTIGGFLYLTVASIAAGMTLNAVRWAVIDTVHAYTGLALPSLDFSRLTKNVAAYGLLIEIHYRHYQFFGSMVLACGIAYACYRVKLGGFWPLAWLNLAFVVLEVIFFVTSRDTYATPASIDDRGLRWRYFPMNRPIPTRDPSRLSKWSKIWFPDASHQRSPT
jgi:hypothetical protein